MDTYNKVADIERTALAKAVALTIAISISGSALAETSPSSQETMQILGETYRNTATKTSLEPEETPQGISIIESEQLKQRGAKSLNQALRYAPGVVTENRGAGVTMFDTFAIRGFENNQSYYDGLAVSLLPGWNLQPQVDPIVMQQVEIFKGPTSVLYGAMPPGGMINMIAKAPQSTSSTEVSASVGSNNLTEASVDTTGQLGNSDVNYRLIALARLKDGQADYTEEERYLIAPSIDWNISESTLLNLNLYYQNDPAMGMNSAIPASGMVYANSAGSTSPSTYAGDKNWSTFEREFLMLGYKFSHELTDSWTFLQNFRYTNADLKQENTYHTTSNFDETTGTLSRNIYSTDEEYESYALDNQLSGFIYTGNAEHNLLFGVDYQNLDGKSDYKEYTSSDSGFYTFNIFSPNNNLLNRNTLSVASVYNTDISSEQLGLYFQDQIRLDQLVFIAGGRFDNYKGETNGTKADQEEFSYRIGALYEFDSGVSPFISYATSFEPTFGVDASGNNYKPEMGEQWEAGVKYVSADGAVNGSASLFHITKSDVLVADPDDIYNYYKVQLGEVVSQGIELEGQFLISDVWNTTVNYTYLDMEITKDTTANLKGKTPVKVPTHSANVWSNYFIDTGTMAGTRVSGGIRYVGTMQMDAANSAKVPDYTLVDLSVGYDLGNASDTLEGATVNLIANNLFDKEYYICYDSANCWYGAEQTIELNVNFKY